VEYEQVAIVEHFALVIDHAVGRTDAHVAPAKGMRGHQITIEAPCGWHQRYPACRMRQSLVHIYDRIHQRTRLADVPIEPQLPLSETREPAMQVQTSIPRIHPLREPRHDSIEPAVALQLFADPAQQDLRRRMRG